MDAESFKVLTDISDRLARVETKQELLAEDMKEVKAQDVIQNRLLDEHIAGVKALNQLVQIESAKLEVFKQDVDSRLAKVETPFKFISINKTALVWVGGVCSALAGIAKLLGLF